MQNNNKDDLPIITDENEKEYWIEYKNTLSPQIKEALIIKYKYLLEVVANKLKSNIGKGRFISLDYEDLVCLGYSGLLEAIDRYPPDKDVKFKSYAIVRIQRAIYDEATRINYFCYPKSRFLNDAKTLLDEESKILILYYHEGLTFKEIAEKMDISRSEVHQLLTKAQKDLDKVITITDENEKEYWIKFRKTFSHKIKMGIFNKYKYLIEYAVKRNIKFTSKYGTYHNLRNFGGIGFLEAINEYNPNSEIKFEKYAINKITKRIYDFIKFVSVIKIKKNYLPKFAIGIIESKKIEEVREILEEILEINFRLVEKDKAISSYLGITLKEYNEIIDIISEKNKIKSAPVSSSDIFCNDDLTDENYIINILKSDGKYNPILIKAIEKLPEKECEILLLYYYDNCDLRDMEKIFGSKTWRIHDKAIKNLKYILLEIKKIISVCDTGCML